MRVVFEKIRWRNFLSTGDYDIEVSLNKAKTTLLCGKNGVGKSILSDALCFVLFGKPFRSDVNKPQLINSITRKGCLVEIEFTRGNQKFHIRRGMKPNIFEIYKNGELIDQASRAKDYQTWLEENVLKTNYKTFCQIVIIGEANFTPFMKLPAHHRRTIIEDLLDISIFSTMNHLVKEKNSRVSEQIKNTENSVDTLQNIIKTKKRHREEVAGISKNFIDEKKKALDEQKSEIKRLRTEHDKIVIDDTARKQLEKLREKKYKLEMALQKLDKRRDSLKKRQEHFENLDVCPSCEQKIDDDQRGTKLEEINESLEDNTKNSKLVRDKIEEIDKDIEVNEKAEREWRELREKKTQLQYSIESGKKNEKELERSIEGLEKLESERKTDDGLEDDKSKLSEENKNFKKLKYLKELYQDALSMLKDTGVKAEIISEYVPLINSLVNEYLDKLEFFCEFYIDEEFKEHIRSQYRDEFSYGSFSQGQKMRIDLALLFTWREIARLRNSSSFNLLILDEVMDSSLDADGTEEFLNLLFTLTNENNVFIISHKADTIVDKFDDVLYFDMRQNFTRISDEPTAKAA